MLKRAGGAKRSIIQFNPLDSFIGRKTNYNIFDTYLETAVLSSLLITPFHPNLEFGSVYKCALFPRTKPLLHYCPSLSHPFQVGEPYSARKNLSNLY